MEAKNADLAALRINRSGESAGPAPRRRTRVWLAIGLPAAAILVLAAVVLITSGALGSAVAVHLTPAPMVSPVSEGAVLIARGCVVAHRRAAVASHATG